MRMITLAYSTRRKTLVAAGVTTLSLVTAVLAPGPGGTALAAGSTGLTCTTGSGTWPQYQADPTHAANACSDITTSNVGTLLPSWFFPTPGEVTATPAVVGGTVYVGDSTGAFYALNQSTGAQEWTFNTVAAQSCWVDQANPYTSAHTGGFGDITSSANVTTVDGTPTVYVGADGSLFALNAATGHCIWAQDTDPAAPASAIEVESSPVVDTAVSPPEVLIGNDDNGVPGIAVTGLMAFNAQTGALLWKYQPERDVTLTPSEFGGSDALTLSCGDGVADTTYCNSSNVPGLAPNTASYADACGDVWSSPALDASFTDPAGDNTFEGSGTVPPAGWAPKQITASGQASADGLVVIGTGNCAASPDPATAEAHGDYAYNQGAFALDPVTGVRVWSFIEPYNSYDTGPGEPLGGDDDFGGSAILAQVPSANVTSTACASSGGNTSLVIEGSKDGYAYGLCEVTGATVWQNQIAQPGQLSPSIEGSIGGFVASPALGADGGRATAFFASAIPLPFSYDGVSASLSLCPAAVLAGLPLTSLICPDLSLLTNPTRVLPLTAVDAATGTVDWRAASLPTYGAVTVTNGVVFSPQTVGLSVLAYNASTGVPLWAFPIGADPSSGAAISGKSIFFGAGTAFETLDGVNVPPQATGVWGFTTSSLLGLLHHSG